MKTPSEQFIYAMSNHGLTTYDGVITDGLIHRFSTNGKSSDKAGWYAYHDCETPWGAFGCHRNQIKVSWRADIGTEFTQAEKDEFHQKMVAQQNKVRADELSYREELNATLTPFIEQLEPALNHNYLDMKGIEPFGAKTNGNQLVIPIYFDGDLISYQEIYPDGQKRFMKGGRTKGGYFEIGKTDDLSPICICEGYATGASIHQATHYKTVIAFSAENLLPVAQRFREKYQSRKFIICADDDWKRDVNIGLSKANETAISIKGMVATPKFNEMREDIMTDFNDMHQFMGLDAVKTAIDEAEIQSIVNWVEPQPLPSMPAVATFNYELLPKSLREAIRDIAENMQCPPDFPATAIIVALSSLIGAKAKIAPKVHAEWSIYPNLWGMVVGRSSAKKTPSLEPILKPLYRLQEVESERMKQEIADWEIENTLHELMKKSGEKKALEEVRKNNINNAKNYLTINELPLKPTTRRFIVNDATVEKLGEILKDNPYGLLCFRDEMYGLFKSMDKQGQEGARSFYLTSYNGNLPYAFDRISRGTVPLNKLCLALLGGIQPSRLQEYMNGALSGGAGDDGLLQRFSLAVYPDMNPVFKYVDRQPNIDAKAQADAVFVRLANLEPNDDVPWRFDDAAQAIFIDWYTDFEQSIRQDEMHPAMESHLLKYSKLIPALALIFTLIDNPNLEQRVAENELRRALAWGDYLRTHAERIYHSANKPSVTGAKRILAEILKGKIQDGFTAREIAQKGWSGLEGVESVNIALELLVEFDYLQSISTKSPNGGRESTKYIINPHIVLAGKK